MRFWHPDLAAEPARLAAYATTLQASPGATFTLICRRRRLGHNSWLHGAAHDGDTDGAAWLAPADLVVLGVPEGGDILLHTPGATLQMPAVPVSGVSPGTVVVPHGVPGMNVNALVPSGVTHLEPLSGQHRMIGIAVQVTVAPQSGL
jgi:anaerobic selenocysteine-containing dehydrogenase